MMSRWEPHREPFRVTLLRTGGIALIVGAVLASFWGGLSRWPVATLLVLWPSLGGHFVEIWFLNWLRPRLSDTRAVHVAARLVVWFVGGVGLLLGMCLTAMALVGRQPAQWPAWWIGGLAFIAMELLVHALLQLSGRPSFYNGRG